VLLSRLDGELRRAVEVDDVQLRVMASELVTRRGKRLRAALVFLAGSYGRSAPDELVRAAVALELMHAASLVHDDVMDRARVRRGGASANARWGNGYATLTGTFLFARASALLAALGEAANRLAAAACVALVTGQLNEVDNAYNLDVTLTRRLEILRRKTATLFELPCRLGAHLTESDADRAEALAAYGEDLGLAFQLCDDALDVEGRPDVTGKPGGIDVREGVYSVPVVLALRRDDAPARELREILTRAQLGAGGVARAVELVRASGAASEVRALARARAKSATRRLTALPPGPARTSLAALADFAAARSA
jgi:geranylgeranyl pyrophosphate synthase